MWMSDVQGGDLSDRKRIFQNCQFRLSYYLLKIPKLGIQLPNAGENNQCCLILTALFNRTEQLQLLQCSIYSSTLIYTNATIATALRGCKYLNWVALLIFHLYIYSDVKHQFMALFWKSYIYIWHSPVRIKLN